jgi:ESS family glutamate:Na+ symporter
MFNLRAVFFAYIWVAILILIGRFLKHHNRWMQRLYLPESVIAGTIALVLSPQITGTIAKQVLGGDHWLVGGVLPKDIQEVWRQSPSIFISVVFAAMFLGKSMPSLGGIWRKAAPQIIFGQSLAWGQYVVGIGVTLLILIPLFNAHPISATLIEIAFEGGHGTAAGMADTLRELGFGDGADLALGLATVGIVSGIIAGTALAVWGRQRGYIRQIAPLGVGELEEIPELLAIKDSPAVKRKRGVFMQSLLIDPLSLSFGFVGIAVIIGWLILQGLMQLELATWGQTGFKAIAYVPLFPMAMIGSILVQFALDRLGLGYLIILPLVESIGGVALDVVVVTALGTISLVVIGSNIGVFLILGAAGILWNVGFFLYYAPKIFPDYWFAKGLADMGQSMGVTATGILLLRMVDPKNESGGFESFAYKQLLFEPIVGGGLFTAIAPALIQNWGLMPVLLLTTGILVFWLMVGYTLMSARL